MPLRSTYARAGSPAISTLPLVGRKYPSNIAMRVLFPAPFGPATPKISPSLTCKENSSTALTELPRSDL
jgi:hypothetical protein